MNDRIDFRFLTAADPLWGEVTAYARGCSWRAGPSLASAMERGDLDDWEGVIVALDGETIAGYCTVAKTDCIPDAPYTPYIGYVFVGEAFRGHRLSGRMIDFACAYLKTLGFDRVYLVSDHENLYEKYGFSVIDHRPAPWSSIEKIYMRRL